MSKANKAAEDIQSFLNKLKPLFELQDFLVEVGSVEQYTHEAGLKKAKSVEDRDAAIAAQVGAEALLSSIKDATAKANDTLAKVEAAAKSRAASIVEAANSTASKIIKNAEYEKSLMDRYLAEANDKLNSINESAAKKYSEFTELQEKINALKAKLSAFVG